MYIIMTSIVNKLPHF